MITALDQRTALVLIDLQNMIVNLPLAHSVKKVLDNANLLLDEFHNNQLPVILVNVNPTGAAWIKSRKDTASPVRTIDEEMTEIVKEIRTNGNDLRVTKHTWNAFFATQLHDLLRTEMVTGIVLAGISTSIGVEGTARSASELGYNISFAVDAMTDSQEEAHTRSIKYIFPRIGETGTTAEIIAMLKQGG
jgi:nicotinamidase-related amidase